MRKVFDRVRGLDQLYLLKESIFIFGWLDKLDLHGPGEYLLWNGQSGLLWLLIGYRHFGLQLVTMHRCFHVIHFLLPRLFSILSAWRLKTFRTTSNGTSNVTWLSKSAFRLKVIIYQEAIRCNPLLVSDISCVYHSPPTTHMSLACWTSWSKKLRDTVKAQTQHEQPHFQNSNQREAHFSESDKKTRQTHLACEAMFKILPKNSWTCWNYQKAGGDTNQAIQQGGIDHLANSGVHLSVRR